MFVSAVAVIRVRFEMLKRLVCGFFRTKMVVFGVENEMVRRQVQNISFVIKPAAAFILWHASRQQPREQAEWPCLVQPTLKLKIQLEPVTQLFFQCRLRYSSKYYCGPWLCEHVRSHASQGRIVFMRDKLIPIFGPHVIT